MNNDPTRACFIHGIGTAVPAQRLTLAQSEKLLQQGCPNRRSEKLLQRIGRLTGIETRHLAALDFMDGESEDRPLYRPNVVQPGGPGMGQRSAAFDLAVGPLIARALDGLPRAALANVGTLVTASCTHASSPGLEIPIFAHGAVPTSVQRWNLGFMGCSAGLAAVRLVRQTDCRGRPALVAVCELSSLHFQYTDQVDQMTANVLFADGAAAVLLSSRKSPIEIVDCRCASFPASADQMVWFAGDHGLQLRLSQALPETVAAQLPRVLSTFLRDNQLDADDIDHWLVHPGGPQILDSVERSLDLAPKMLESSRRILRRFGNMSSPTIFFILKELLDAGGAGLAVAVAFGPGLTIELALLRLEP